MPQTIELTIEQNVGLVYLQLHRFNLAYDADAESIGYEALYRAACSFDDTKGIKFSTYASVCIYNALGSYLRSIKKQRQLEVVSYNAIVDTNGDVPTEFINLMPSSLDTEKDYIKSETLLEIHKAYLEVLKELTNEKHKIILSMWYDSGCSATTVQIATDINMSQAYVSQTLSRAKHLLKNRLEDFKW